jgi:hypothetical protein
MTDKRARPYTTCRACGVNVDARLVRCPECGGCCPGCTTSGLQVRISDTPASRRLALARSSPCGKLLAMHEEIGHAMMEAIWEMDNLPAEPDLAIARIHAVMDDLEEAMGRTRALDNAEDRPEATVNA